MAEEKQNAIPEKPMGAEEEATTIWHIVCKNNKEYDLVTNWKSLGEATAALNDPQSPFIGGLDINPQLLKLDEKDPPVVYNFVMIRASEITSIAGTF